MNRLKKEFRKRGVKLNEDYECLPFYVKGKSCFDPGYICVENVTVNSVTASVITVYNVGDVFYQLHRDGSIEKEVML